MYAAPTMIVKSLTNRINTRMLRTDIYIAALLHVLKRTPEKNILKILSEADKAQ
jgi:hypothetical protein